MQFISPIISCSTRYKYKKVSLLNSGPELLSNNPFPSSFKEKTRIMLVEKAGVEVLLGEIVRRLLSAELY